MAFGRTYFGGPIDPERATPVVLQLGEQRAGVDMTLQLVPTATLQARAVMPDGTPPVDASYVFTDGWSSTGAALSADGRFERRNLAPGRYRLTVRGRGAGMSGAREIEVAGEDIRDLTIALEPAARLSGRIAFEPGDAAPPDPTQIQVALSPFNLLTPARVGADGRWLLALVDPGRYRMNPSIPAAARETWSLKSIVLNGRDVADARFDVAAGEAIADIVITFTSRKTSLSGRLLTADDQPAAGFYVVVFSDDPSHWIPSSRRVPAPVRAAMDGAYHFPNIPPGTYRLAALTHVDPSDLANPAFLNALKASAIVVTLEEGQSVRQDVKFGK
jgi:hypothetical protein